MNNLKKTQDSYNLFLNNIIKDILLFVFLTFVFLVYKIIFLFIFRTELADISIIEIMEALFLSVKFSLNTVGLLVFISFLFSSAIQQFYRKYPAGKIRLISAGIFFFIISLLFQIKVPYYMEFHVSFSPFIFNTFNDDVNAIFQTITSQYGFFPRIGMSIFITFILIILFRYCLKFADFLFNLIKCFNPKKMLTFFILVLIVFVYFVGLGGTTDLFTDYMQKDKMRINKHLLKENFPDEIKYFYDVFCKYKETHNKTNVITPDEIKNALSVISNQERKNDIKSDTLLPLITHISKGSPIKKPKYIFLIIGENYALWPFLDKYENLPLTKNMRNLLKKHDNIFVKKFLPAASGTMQSFSGIVTGLLYLDLYERTNSYETSLFPQISKQGYKTRFLYGRIPSLSKVDAFISGQGVNEAYYGYSFPGEASVWGIDDKSLFQGVLNTINDEPSFNLILTVSNHSPFPIDMDKETEITSKTEMEKFIKEDVKDKDLLIKKMQHYEYMDKTIADFIETVLQKYPNSLFVITGDHAERWNLGSNPTFQERLAVPLIIIADGISSNKDNKDFVGSHIDIIPTIMELVSPKGTIYYSLGKDILHEQDLGFNDYSWVNSKMINYGFFNKKEKFNPDDSISYNEIETAQERVDAYKTISAWYVSHGLKLK